ncbi:MAG: HDIG domain-containing protein, partial [Planctomycetes bacterium]|nr:HDIG domain-containing protein [Planctomycetota bacterium]
YHDIGKIHRPAYFAENQEGRISRHENLSPTMSLLIILGHVKDGLEMARQYKLPRTLHQFIGEHHGTTVVRYFHRVASDKQPQIASGRHDREISEVDFRYGGPKPRSREAAVLMLCDGVEGAVRALSEPTVGRIESTVQTIVSDRLNDGQFDECDITLREIRLVEESLVKTLCSIYHGRVAYPKASKAEEESQEPKRLSV